MTPSTITTASGILKVQAVATQPWEQALQGFALDRIQVQKHLATLFRTGFHLAHVSSADELFTTILDETVQVLQAQRGCILLDDPATGQLKPRTVCAIGKGINPQNAYNQTLAYRSFLLGESLLCQDASYEGDPQSTQSSLRKNMAS